jgi:hypothetical protein
VKEVIDRRGRMPYRLWYEEAEIEAIMESELRRAGAPRRPGRPATDVDLFLERHLGIVPQYVWLPAGVQGATEFSAEGRVEIQVSSELSLKAERDPVAEYRLRSTLAHEAAHVLLHRALFLKESKVMFGGLRTRRELCREVRVSARGYSGEWWEWQANRGMAALLLPRPDLQVWLDAWRAGHPGRGHAQAMQDQLSRAFDVSGEAVRHRLRQLRAAPADSRAG